MKSSRIDFFLLIFTNKKSIVAAYSCGINALERVVNSPMPDVNSVDGKKQGVPNGRDRRRVELCCTVPCIDHGASAAAAVRVA